MGWWIGMLSLCNKVPLAGMLAVGFSQLPLTVGPIFLVDDSFNGDNLSWQLYSIACPIGYNSSNSNGFHSEQLQVSAFCPF